MFILLVFIQAQSEQEAKLFESQVPTIVTLTKGCKSVEVVRDIQEIPAGCGSAVLTPTVAVHILVRVSQAIFSLVVDSSVDHLVYRDWSILMRRSRNATRNLIWQH
jgi:hypothetical protein